MRSQTVPLFWRAYARLPKDVRRRAAKAYRLWLAQADAPSLQFKRVSNRQPVYSVRVSESYRVLGLFHGDTVTWFWIGSHDEYERWLKGM
jgi:hypothetical protein